MKRKVIITGFEPFGSEKINPSYEAIKQLPKQIDGAEIKIIELPVVYGKAGKRLEEFIKQEQPEIVLCVGQAGGRTSISFEKVAINYKEAGIPDNAGNVPLGLPVLEEGETAYFSNLPLKAMVKAVREAKIPAEISYTAGTYVCNDLFYHLMEMIYRNAWKIQGGFVHVPFLLEQAAEKPSAVASMSLESITEALHIAIKVALLGKEETEENMGKIF